ncbi:MAG: hypothetical protein ACYS76_14260 [Planctomycetota bacterium]|jgi:Zn finger protein HypA/HybF involved in hydrogenase expression
MNKNMLLGVSLGGWLCLLALVPGCYVRIGGCGQAKREKTEELSVSMAGLEALDVETSFGSITLVGDDVTECRIKAKIFAQAPSAEEAKQMLEEAKVRAEPVDGTLNIRVEKPRLGCNRCIGASIDIIVPKQTSVESKTSFGSIKVKDIPASPP